jgi:hypothetical protein
MQQQTAAATRRAASSRGVIIARGEIRRDAVLREVDRRRAFEARRPAGAGAGAGRAVR